MRKILFLMLFLIAIPTVLNSCRSSNNDEETEETTADVGNFKVDGAQYKITQGVVQGHKGKNSQDESNYSFSFMSVDGTTVRIPKITVYFPYNQNMDGSFTLNGSNKGIDSFLSSYTVQIGNTMDSSNDLTQGTCTIKRNSTSNFTVTFSIKPANGKVITGEFNGEAMVQEF